MVDSRKMWARLFIALFSLACFSVAFGGGGGSSSGGGAHKPLFSLWTWTGPEASTFDLRGQAFDTPTPMLLIFTEAQCACTFTISGNQASGTMTGTGCTTVSGPAQCPATIRLTYTNENAVLTIDHRGSVSTFNRDLFPMVYF